jgi:thioredoxin 2
MTASVSLLKCAWCGAKNRVHVEKLRDHAPVCGRCGAALTTDEQPAEVTDASFASDVEASPLPVLLDAWAPWCAPCRAIAPMMHEIAGEMKGRIRVVKLNVDQNPLTASRLGIHGIPTLMVFKDGREVDRIVGAPPREMLLNRLRALT